MRNAHTRFVDRIRSLIGPGAAFIDANGTTCYFKEGEASFNEVFAKLQKEFGRPRKSRYDSKFFQWIFWDAESHRTMYLQPFKKGGKNFIAIQRR